MNFAQLDKWTEDFEAEEDRRKREAAAALAEEGWTVVKRRGVCPTPWLAASECPGGGLMGQHLLLLCHVLTHALREGMSF